MEVQLFFSLRVLTLSILFSFILTKTYGKPSITSDKDNDLVPNKDMASVCKILQTLDKELSTMNIEPPVDGGTELMRKLHTYNQAAMYLLQYCKTDQINAFNAAKDMLERGGPEFLDVDLDESTIEHRFQWDKEALQEMHNARKRTNILWYDLWRIYNKVPIPGEDR